MSPNQSLLIGTAFGGKKLLTLHLRLPLFVKVMALNSASALRDGGQHYHRPKSPDCGLASRQAQRDWEIHAAN